MLFQRGARAEGSVSSLGRPPLASRSFHFSAARHGGLAGRVGLGFAPPAAATGQAEQQRQQDHPDQPVGEYAAGRVHAGTGTEHGVTVDPQAPLTPERAHELAVVGSGRGPDQPEHSCAGPGDVAAALEVIATDPVVNVFADYRTRITQLDTRWLGGEMWGYLEGDRLVSMCHVGANLVPVNATPAACDAFVERRRPDRAAELHDRRPARRGGAAVGRASRSTGRRPRDFRWDQPHMVATRPPPIAARPAGAAYHQGGGGRPLPGLRGDVHRGGRHLARRSTVAGTSTAPGSTSSSAAAGRSRASRTDGWCSRPRWPARRRAPARSRGCTSTRSCAGQGLCAAGMATVVDICLREIAPSRLALRQRAQRAGAGGVPRRPGSSRPGPSRRSCSDAGRRLGSRHDRRRPLTKDVKFLVGVFVTSGVVHLVRPGDLRADHARSSSRRTARSSTPVASPSWSVRPGCCTRGPAGWLAGPAWACCSAVYPANFKMAGDALQTEDKQFKAAALGRLPLQLPLIRAALRAARG